jgi:hypothetical protein
MSCTAHVDFVFTCIDTKGGQILHFQCTNATILEIVLPECAADRVKILGGLLPRIFQENAPENLPARIKLIIESRTTAARVPPLFGSSNVSLYQADVGHLRPPDAYFKLNGNWAAPLTARQYLRL